MSFPSDHPLTRRVLEGLLQNATLRSLPVRAELLTNARRSLVFPPVYRWLGARGFEMPGSQFRVWRRHAVNIAAWREDLRRTLAPLRDAEIDFVVLKGPPLSRMLFGDDTLRRSSDIDLLIAPERAEDATGTLQNAGFGAINSEQPQLWSTNQLPLVTPTTGRRVEIHWLLSKPHLPSPDPRHLLRVSESMEFDDDLRILVLPPLYQLLHIALHFQHHGGFLKGLLDFTAWIDAFRDDVDPQRAAQICRQYQILRVVELLQETTGLLAASTDASRRLPFARGRPPLSVRLAARILAQSFASHLSPGPSELRGQLSAMFDEWIGHGRVRKALSALYLDTTGASARALAEGLVRALLRGDQTDRICSLLESAGILRRFGGLRTEIGRTDH